MKTYFTSILFLVVCYYSNAQEFQNIDSLFAKAKSENKKVLLYFSGSDWCAPCIRFKKNFIEQSKFIAFTSSHLLVYNADFPRKKSNQLDKHIASFNEKLADKYNSQGTFPKIILFDFNGRILKEWEKLPTESLEEFITSLQ